MKKREVLVLGGGIAGLAAAHFLKKSGVDAALLEKKSTLGGWCESHVEKGFFFERGPRTFPLARAQELFALIQELGLEEQILYAEKKLRRYRLFDGRLKGFFSFAVLKALLKERKVPYFEGEETVRAFATRRFGKEIAEQYFSCMVRGIYAGDLDELSLSATFPSFKQMEKEYGSLTRALFKKKKKSSPLFSLKKGISQLIDALAKNLDVHLHEEILSIEEGKGVLTTSGFWEAEHLICALPAYVSGKLLGDADLCAIPYCGIKALHMAWERDFLKRKRGFGLLVPETDASSLLGVVFDSDIFPAQGKGLRITAMHKEGGELIPEKVQEILAISEAPKVQFVTDAKRAIPQYTLGHQERVKRIEGRYQKITFVGNYLHGVSVNDAILSAKEGVANFLARDRQRPSPASSVRD